MNVTGMHDQWGPCLGSEERVWCTFDRTHAQLWWRWRWSWHSKSGLRQPLYSSWRSLLHYLQSCLLRIELSLFSIESAVSGWPCRAESLITSSNWSKTFIDVSTRELQVSEALDNILGSTSARSCVELLNAAPPIVDTGILHIDPVTKEGWLFQNLGVQVALGIVRFLSPELQLEPVI